MIWQKSHRIRQDLTGSWMDLARSCRIWRDLAAFQRIPMRSVSLETNHHLPATRTNESITVTSRLQVEKPPTQTVMGQLRVGQKPDPPDSWTAPVSRMTIVFAYIHSDIVFCKKVPLKAILYTSTNCFINYGALLPLWFDTLSFPCFSLLCCIPSIPQFLCFTSKSSKGEDGLTFHWWEPLVSLHWKKGSPRKVHIW